MERPLQLLKALSDRTRLRLLHLLANRGPEVCVCDLVEVLEVPQSTISRQIAPLRMLSLIQGRRRGTWILYSLTAAEGDFHAALIGCLGPLAGADPVFSSDLDRYDELLRRRALVCCQPEMRRPETEKMIDNVEIPAELISPRDNV